MSEIEQKKQRIKAQSILELMLLQKRTGKYTDADIAAQREIIASLKTFQHTAIQEPAAIEPKHAKVIVEFSDAAQLLLNGIQEELNQIDDEKNSLGNRLADIPDTVNCVDLVQKIKALRKKWVDKNDEFWYVKTHGELPIVQSIEKPTVLPTDKMELHKMLLNTRTNVSKYKARMATTKTEIKRQHYEKNIRVAQNLLNEIETKLSVL